MKKILLWSALLLGLATLRAPAADLPTVSVEHLYYLSSRGERIRQLRPEEMIEYCLALKLGGRGFEDLYAQVLSLRLELTRLLRIEEIQADDPRVVRLQKTMEEYYKLLRDEVKKVQNGLVQEGQVAGETLKTIGRAQNQQR